ncbi:hypothetical protein BC827DRAFT_573120 [Russula dissimulans]|nr:hypothetical protein BC827DRAFT_573120 [Russula dissimulans]
MQPPIWSILEYMLLVETLNIDDTTLGKRLGLPSLSNKSDLGSTYNTRRQGKSLKMTAVDKSMRHTGKLTDAPGAMLIRCFDAQRMELKLVTVPHSRHAKKPFIHLDHYLGGDWSSVYASSKSQIVIKFAAVPKKDKAELEHQLNTEKVAYQRLSQIAGWVVPRLYGEYRWFGGRALILSDEGQSLSHLEKFGSLSLIERLILFAELCCIHYLGVEHRDFAPRNVLHKKWSCLPKIIDFGFSNVGHSCPGWKECGELKGAWHELQLDGARSRSESWVRRWVSKDRSYRIFIAITTIVLTILYCGHVGF